MDPPQFETMNRGQNQGQVPPSNRSQTITDPRTFQTRNDIYTKNANLFIANNANPFLISPYAPPANLISKQLIEQLSAIVSTLSYSLSSVINLNTFTLSICTIRPIDPNQEITIVASTLNIIGAAGSRMNVSLSSFFNYVSSNYLNVSSMNAGFLGYSTLTGSTITTNTLFANTFVSTPTVSTTTIRTNTLFAATSLSTNTLVTSTLFASTMVASTLFASTSISTNIIQVSSLFANTNVSTPIISTVSISSNTIAFRPGNYHITGAVLGGFTPVNPSQGAIEIDVGGTTYRIPYYT